ncbi:MAG TPA: hypothetical protein VF678_02740 [bacterium]
MGRWIRNGLAVMAAVLVATSAAAADKRIVNLQLFTQNDLRALAMGNAFGAIARGEDALFYNPAGLAQFNFDLKAEYSAGFSGSEKFALDTYNATSNATNQELLDYLNRYTGTTQRFNANTLLSAVANLGYTNFGFGFGALDSHRYSLTFIDDGLAPNIGDPNDHLAVADDRLRMQSAAVAFKLGNGKILLGLAAKPFTYSEGSTSVQYGSISGNLDLDISGKDFASATTYDLGMLYRLEFWPALKPQASLVAYNIGGGELKNKVTQEVVQVPPSYNVGFAFGPDTGFVHWLVSFELEDITDALKTTDFGSGMNAGLACNAITRTQSCVNQPRSLLQRTHIGGELGFWRTPTGNNILNLRAGNNRGYFTYGAEVNLWALRILYAKGADNLGWQDSPDKFDFTAYQIGFGFAW